MKSLVRSVALYGVETWTLLCGDNNRLEALEMWLSRTMEITS